MCTFAPRTCAALFASLVLICHVTPVRGADEPSRDASSRAADPLRETTVYIPYDRLRETFERDGRGVFLPYEQFQELWRAATDKNKLPDQKPPLQAILSEISSEADVSRDVVRVRSSLIIELLADGWHQVPLRLSDAAITSATIDGQPAQLLVGPDGSYRFLIEKKTKEPERVELILDYVKAFTRSPGLNSVSFNAPQAPIHRWRMRVPEDGVKINIRPMLAATEVPTDATGAVPVDETILLAFVGGAPSVQIDWTPRSEGATGLNALISVQSTQRVWFDEGVVRSTVVLNYDIRRGSVEQLTLDVPVDQKVVNVFDANIRQWSVAPVGELQRITAELFQPTQGTQQISVELERFNESRGDDEFRVPVVAAVGVGRQQGVVGIGVAEGLRVEPLRWTGMSQIDSAEMPRSTTGQGPWAVCYRFATVPFDLVLRVVRIEPRITVDAFAEVRLEPQEIVTELRAVYTIEKAGIFRLEFDIPQGYQLDRVHGFSASGVEPAAVESKQLSEDKRRLTVNLSRAAKDRVGCEVRVRRDVNEPDLLSATGKTVSAAIEVPRVVGPFLERTTGRLILRSPESLRINATATEGLRTLTMAEAQSDANNPPKSSPDEGALAFAFGDEPISLSLQVERRKPHITARQFLLAKVEAGVVGYEATFMYDIRYTGVESLRIDVPRDLVEHIHCETKGIHESVIEPTPQDVEPGYSAVRLRGEAKFARQVTIRFSWETKLESFEVGESREIAVPCLKPEEVDRAWGQIAVIKGESIDVRPASNASAAPTGVRPIDPRHDLMDGAAAWEAAEAARAFEFHDDWSLTLAATRYRLEETKRTSIERGLVRVVITRGDQLSMQALYRVRSAHQRLAIQLPTEATLEHDPARINGRPVSLERGKADEVFVPLTGQSPDAPFLLEIRYSQPRKDGSFVFPVFPSQPAVQRVYVTAYVPPERVLLGATGPWTDELRWFWNDGQGFTAVPRKYDGELIQWVTEGISLPANPSDSFQVDGVPYLFSALQPAAPPEGTLALVTIDETWWRAMVVIVLLAIGLVLVRTSLGARCMTLGVFFIVCVLSGVFLPTFSMQVLDGVTIWAILIVLVIWAVHHLGWVRPRDPFVVARRQERENLRLAQISTKTPISDGPTSTTPGTDGGGAHA